VETDLTNHALAARISGWQANGFRVSLFFISLPRPDLAVARVEQRVFSGGHDIPEATIRRRFHVGLHNLFEVYIPLVDAWRVYENGSEYGPQLIAHGLRWIQDREAWTRIQMRAKQSKGDFHERQTDP
jgi:predicted ABC-type ATPase